MKAALPLPTSEWAGGRGGAGEAPALALALFLPVRTAVGRVDLSITSELMPWPCTLPGLPAGLALAPLNVVVRFLAPTAAIEGAGDCACAPPACSANPGLGLGDWPLSLSVDWLGLSLYGVFVVAGGWWQVGRGAGGGGHCRPHLLDLQGAPCTRPLALRVQQLAVTVAALSGREVGG